MNPTSAHLLARLEPEHNAGRISGRYRSGAKTQFYIARQAARVGDTDLGNEFLARSIEGGYWTTAPLRRDPWLDSLRDTNRFRELLASAEEREDRSRREFQAAGGDEVLALGVHRASQHNPALA